MLYYLVHVLDLSSIQPVGVAVVDVLVPQVVVGLLQWTRDVAAL